MYSTNSLPPYSLRFNVEGKVFTCYNCDSTNAAFPSTPDPLPLLDDYSPRYLRQINYQHEKYPFLAFIPVRPNTTGQIMGRFADIQLENDENGWRLAESQADSWYRLGKAVGGMAQYLWENLREDEGINLPFKLTEYTRPEQYGYMFRYKYKEEAMRRIHDSREAFLPLFAMLSFVLAFYEFSPTSVPENRCFAWYKKLILKGVGSTWLNDLRDSDIADFDIKRVGVIVDFCVAEKKEWWSDNLHFFIKAGLPIVINWGLVPFYVPDNFLYRKFRPTEKEFMDTKYSFEQWADARRIHPVIGDTGLKGLLDSFNNYLCI